MKTIVFIISFIYPLAIFCQGINLANQKTIGGSISDEPKCIVSLPNNNYLVVGFSNSGISGDKTEATRGSSDYWILKLDQNYNIIWQKTYGGSGYDKAQSCIRTIDNKYIIVGTSTSGISGDKTIANYGSSDIWTICLDSLGNILWQNAYGGSDGEGVTHIYELNNGNLLISGISNSGISGNKTEENRGESDFWLICIDDMGNFIWDKTIGGSSFDSYSKVFAINDNEFIIVGESSSDISFEKTENSYGETDIWCVKYNKLTNQISDKAIGGSLTDQIGNVIYANNYVYIISGSSSNISGLKSENSRGYNDYWIVKLDTAFNIIWDKTIGGDNSDFPTDVEINENNELFVLGTSFSNASGDKTENLYENGFHDNWIIMLNENGNLISQKDIGGSQFDYSTSSVLSNNKLVCSGYSDSGISGLKTETCRGDFDYWLYDLDITTEISNLEKTAVNIFPNPANTTITLYLESEMLNGNIAIFNVQGKKIMEVIADNSLYKTIDVSTLNNGVYFLKYFSNNKSITTKFIKS